MITIFAVTLILVFLSVIILKFIRSHFEKGNNSINTKNGEVDEYLANELEKDKITDLEVISTPLPNGNLKVVSTAIDSNTNEKKSVKCNFNVYNGGNGNIFKYGIVAGKGNINIINSAANITGNISSSNISGNTIPGGKIPEKNRFFWRYSCWFFKSKI